MQSHETSVLVEMEKNAHSQSNAVSGLRCNYLSVWSNWERAAMPCSKTSVRRRLTVLQIFCLYSIVALECFVGCHAVLWWTKTLVNVYVMIVALPWIKLKLNSSVKEIGTLRLVI